MRPMTENDIDREVKAEQLTPWLELQKQLIAAFSQLDVCRFTLDEIETGFCDAIWHSKVMKGLKFLLSKDPIVHGMTSTRVLAIQIDGSKSGRSIWVDENSTYHICYSDPKTPDENFLPREAGCSHTLTIDPSGKCPEVVIKRK